MMKGLLPIFIIVGAAIACVEPRQRLSESPSSPAIIVDSSPVIEYSHRWNWSESGNYFHIEGQVRNISGERLKNVRIVLSFYDKSRNFVTSETAYPDYDPLMPGQTSPYTSMISVNPAIDTYRVEFATWSGEQLIAREMETQKKSGKRK